MTALDAYRRAAAGAPCSLDWRLLAAIGRVESHHGQFGGALLHTDGLSTPSILGPVLDGRGFALIADTDHGASDGDPVHDRAVGPMQFIPSTWALFGRDGNGDRRADPFNIYDATAAAAAYLCRAGGDLSTVAGQARAVFAYNHSDSYVVTVLHLAAAYAGTPPPVIPPTAAESAPVPPVNPGPPPAADQVAAASQAATSEPPPPSPTATASVTPARAAAPLADAATTTPSAAATTTTPVVPSTTPSTTTTPPTTTPPATTATASPPVPTTTPSATPTATPTATPSVTPSPTPTATPSVTPSATPTATPSVTPSVTPSATPSVTPSPTPTATPCATPAPLTIDVLNTTGDPAAATTAVGYLAAPGVVVGTVTTGAAAPSAIEYPAAARDQAVAFATSADGTALLTTATVPHVTVVLGPTGLDTMLTALRKFPGLPAPACG